MPASCIVGGCTQRSDRKSNIRGFLVLHVAPKDDVTRSKWNKRVNRVECHISKPRMESYRVCSDHFTDIDYHESDWLYYKMTGYFKNMKLRLKPTAVPNTCPDTGAYRYIETSETGGSKVGPSRKRRKVNLRTLKEMDDFSSKIDTSVFPYTKAASVDPGDVTEASDPQTDDTELPEDKKEIPDNTREVFEDTKSFLEDTKEVFEDTKGFLEEINDFNEDTKPKELFEDYCLQDYTEDTKDFYDHNDRKELNTATKELSQDTKDFFDDNKAFPVRISLYKQNII